MTFNLGSIEIVNEFRLLETQSMEGDSIVARELPLSGAYIAVNSHKDYLFIVRDSSGEASPSRRLKTINVDYVVRLQAILEGQVLTDYFTVVTLPSRNQDKLQGFCVVLSLLLSLESETATQAGLRPVVEALIDLFSPRSGGIRERAKGLFGELTVLKESPNLEAMILGWHDSSNANKDFSLNDRYLEVKTSEGLVRKHEISLSQLQSDNTNRPVYLVSVLIEEDPVGSSAIDLYYELRDRCDSPDLQSKLTHQVLSVVGLDFDEISELKFSVTGGRQGIWLVPASEIPRPTVDPNEVLSQAISGVRFTTNLEMLNSRGMQPLSLDTLPWAESNPLNL